MAQQVVLAGIQFTAQPGQKEHNLRRAEGLMLEAASFKPDLIVLPEVFTAAGAYDQYMELSEEIPGPTVGRLAELAKKLSSNVVCGSIVERCDGLLFNTAVLLNRQGNLLATYRKIHLFSHYGSQEGDVFARGDQAVVATTDIGTLGLTICYDVRFPELYRALARAGATIIACPSAWPYPRLEHWFLMNRSRAVENQVFYIAPNLVGMVGNKRYLGNSLIVDPWGSVLACGGEQEGIVVARIDMEQVGRLRAEFPFNEDYYPETYCVKEKMS